MPPSDRHIMVTTMGPRPLAFEHGPLFHQMMKRAAKSLGLEIIELKMTQGLTSADGMAERHPAYFFSFALVAKGQMSEEKPHSLREEMKKQIDMVRAIWPQRPLCTCGSDQCPICNYYAREIREAVDAEIERRKKLKGQ